MNKETKSPIKDLPVRLPGESIGDRQIDVVFDKMLPSFIVATFTFIFAWLEWVQELCKVKPHPWVWTIIALLVGVAATWRIKSAFKEIEKLKLARKGEEAVGQYLEEKLRPMGYQILHDILFDNFNIDHVVIGPAGVYSVETKTHSKPAKGAASIQYDGQSVTVNGFKPDRDPVVQAKAEASSLCDLIERSTGRKYFIKPVVLYPGWFVEKIPEDAEVWVLNEKAFPTFVANGKKILPLEDISLITFHLKRYVIARTQEKQS